MAICFFGGWLCRMCLYRRRFQNDRPSFWLRIPAHWQLACHQPTSQPTNQPTNTDCSTLYSTVLYSMTRFDRGLNVCLLVSMRCDAMRCDAMLCYAMRCGER